jgi:hypothetical protein
MKYFIIMMLSLITSFSSIGNESVPNDPIEIRRFCSMHFLDKDLRACFGAKNIEIIRYCGMHFLEEDLRACFKAPSTELIYFCTSHYVDEDMRACFNSY